MCKIHYLLTWWWPPRSGNKDMWANSLKKIWCWVSAVTSCHGGICLFQCLMPAVSESLAKEWNYAKRKFHMMSCHVYIITYHLLSLAITCYHSLSLTITRYHSLSLAITHYYILQDLLLLSSNRWMGRSLDPTQGYLQHLMVWPMFILGEHFNGLFGSWPASSQLKPCPWKDSKVSNT